MRKIQTGFIAGILVCSIMMTNNIYAGPFTDTDKWDDLFLAGSVFYAYGMTVAKEDGKGAIQLTASTLAAQLTTEALKQIVREERPDGSDDLSFPSGHAAGAFSGAMFVHKRYGWKQAIAPYIMSGIVSWSRVDKDAHYWHDVLAGAAVSALFTWVIVDKYNIQVSATTDSVVVRFGMDF